MAQILIRGLDDGVVERLKRQAKEARRSLQAECRLILENAAKLTKAEALEACKQFRKQFGDRIFSDSAELIREDRDR